MSSTSTQPPTSTRHGFYYTAKAAPDERPTDNGTAHPTVKPLDLIRWLVRLVTPPHGLILDPFAGTGTTAEAAMREGFQSIGIEREAEYLPHILQRVHLPTSDVLWAARPLDRRSVTRRTGD